MKKTIFAGVRIPLPRQTGGKHGTPKGAKGYDRKQKKRELVHELAS